MDAPVTTTTRRRTRRLAATGALMAVLALAAGCGADEEEPADDAGSTSAASPTTDPATTDPATTEPTTTDPSAASSAYCAEIDALGSLPELGDGSGDEAALEEALAAFDSLAQAAPAEVADEWEVALPAFRAYLTLVQEGLVDPQDPPPGTSEEEATAANDAVLREAYAEIEPVRAEVDAIGTHAQASCGVDAF